MIERWLDGLARSLPLTHGGVGLTLLVGLSISLSHVFGLFANRLRPRQILLQLLLDGLLLSLALLISALVDMLLLSAFSDQPVPPRAFMEQMGVALLPGLFYVLVAAPYISDLIAVGIWFSIHLNVILLLHARFALPYGDALQLATPGYVLSLVVVAIMFRQRWQAGYRKLAAQTEA